MSLPSPAPSSPAPPVARSARVLGRALLLVSLGASLAGCALFSRGSTIEPRYFSADITPPTAPRSDRAATAGDESRVLRLGKVRAGTDLKEEIVYRTSTHELGFYEIYRWAERPETYLRRGLVQAFYSDRGIKQSLIGSVPTLDVELVFFEEVRGPRPVARVTIMAALHNDREVRYSRTVDVQKPVKADDRGVIDPNDLATSLTEALSEAVGTLADDVVRELGATVTPPPVATPPATASSVATPAPSASTSPTRRP